MIDNGATIALIRQLRAATPTRKKRIGRWQPPRPPSAIALRYFRTLHPIVSEAADLFERDSLPHILRLLGEERRSQGKADASGFNIGMGRAAGLGAKAGAADDRLAADIDDELSRASDHGKRAAREIDRAAEVFARKLRPQSLFDVVKQFGKATDDQARAQLDQQLRQAIGLPLSAIEKPVLDQLDPWATENVDLIVTIPDRYFDRMKRDVLRAFNEGALSETLTETIAENYGASTSDVERIARDQLGRLSSELTETRLTNLGVTRYRWMSARDNRVRDAHFELSQRSARGETFSFDDPPMGGGTKATDRGNPGDGILCRCYPEPDLDALING